MSRCVHTCPTHLCPYRTRSWLCPIITSLFFPGTNKGHPGVSLWDLLLAVADAAAVCLRVKKCCYYFLLIYVMFGPLINAPPILLGFILYFYGLGHLCGLELWPSLLRLTCLCLDQSSFEGFLYQNWKSTVIKKNDIGYIFFEIKIVWRISFYTTYPQPVSSLIFLGKMACPCPVSVSVFLSLLVPMPLHFFMV